MPSTLQAGPLRSRITIEGAVEVSDNMGGTTSTWGAIVQVWAQRLFVSGGERNEAEQVVPREVPAFRVRRRTDITAAMRVRDGSELFAITNVVKDDLDRSMMVLACEEVFES